MKGDHGDEIEVLGSALPLHGRIHIQKQFNKASIHLTADQLEEHARECLALAAKLRAHR